MVKEYLGVVCEQHIPDAILRVIGVDEPITLLPETIRQLQKLGIEQVSPRYARESGFVTDRELRNNPAALDEKLETTIDLLKLNLKTSGTIQMTEIETETRYNAEIRGTEIFVWCYIYNAG